MALYFVKTKTVYSVIYIVNSEEPLNPEKVQDLINGGYQFRDFSQNTDEETVSTVSKMSRNAYLEFFDEMYPEMKSIDTVSKLLQISDINDKVLQELAEPEIKDEY